MRSQLGIALISAMLIAALVTAGAVGLSSTQFFNTRRISNIVVAERAKLAVSELELQAASTLARDLQQGQYDAATEAWASEEFAVELGDVTVVGKLRDLQGLFNLTNLSQDPFYQGGDASTPEPSQPGSALGVAPTPESAASPADSTPTSGSPAAPGEIPKQDPAERQLRLLFRALEIEATPVQAILDWIDPDTETRFPNGAEDDYYAEQAPAYRTANRPFTTPRELLLVKGITPDLYKKLAPFIVCLPQATQINVNTAKKEVLMSLGPGIDRAAAETIQHLRETQPFLTLEMFLKHPLMQARQIPAESVVTKSNYFELRSTARNERMEIMMDSVLVRISNKVSVLTTKRRGFDG
jgi:general secretion pathway protein K